MSKTLHRFLVFGTLLLVSLSLSAESADRIASINDRSGDEGKFVVYFLHLGRVNSSKKSNHGDCEILISPEGQVMMVDCGAPSESAYVVDELKALGIDHIDYFVNSHRHHDHLGGFGKVADSASIDHVLVGPMKGYTGTASLDMDERCRQEGIVQTVIGEGDSFKFGSAITVDVYHPSKTETNEGDYRTETLNNSSLVLKCSYGDTTVLLCGDLYMSGEQQVLDAHADDIRNIDVAKANHHGLWTSNQRTWIETVNPSYCVVVSDILCDIGVMNSYKKQGAIFRQTAFNGIVKFVMDDQDGITMLCQYDSPMDN